MEAFSFGSYYPSDSAIHRLDPRTKLLLGFAFLITALTVGSFRGLAPVAIFVVLVYAVAKVPARRVLSSMAPLLAIVVVVAVLNLFTDQSGRILWQLGFLQISEGSLRSAAFMACRLTLMMAGMSAITLTTPTLDLTAGFERLLAPFARVGLPAHELGMIMGIALRFLPQFATEMKQTADAQTSRGARVTGGPLGGACSAAWRSRCSRACSVMRKRCRPPWTRVAITVSRGVHACIRLRLVAGMHWPQWRWRCWWLALSLSIFSLFRLDLSVRKGSL